MSNDDIRMMIAANPNLFVPIERAAAAAQPKAMTWANEAVALALLFPIIRYILVSIGLPWLYEAKRYSELWRQQFHRWIDEQYQREGLNPDDAEAVGEALRKELERITETSARASWERLADLMKGTQERAK